MPYFKWVGVDLVGSLKKGKQAAHSPQELMEQLLHQGVALLHSKPVYVASFFWPITAQLKARLFQQKAKLLRAGLLLPKALEIAAQQSHNPVVYDMMCAIRTDIQQGNSFIQALKQRQQLCDSVTVVMLAAGDESGNIMNAMENVSLYFDKQHAFNKTIRSVLAMPLLTLLFFIGISSFIFVFIIPRFADMFNSLQQELPPLTRCMIEVSYFICSVSMMYVVIAAAIGMFALYYYFTHAGKKAWDSMVMNMPCIGFVIWQYQMSQTLQALALLINSGVPLVAGLKIVSESVDHCLIKAQLELLHDEVASGKLLSNAMATSSLFLPEIVALIYIGEETGTLGQSLENAALAYNDILELQLKRFVFFLQPTVIVLLGLLVTTLIFAVYLPIMQLSSVL